MLNPGDTVLGMNLSHGGHLSHGSPVNISGKYFNVVSYGVREDNYRLDYDEIRKMAKEHKPKLIVAGASAYPRVLEFKIFREIADEVGAYLMADIAHIAGLVAAGIHPSPVSHAHFVTTTTHKTLKGPRGGMILCDKEYAKMINKAVFPGIQGGPLMHVIAAKAVGFGEVLTDEFKHYQEQVVKNAKALADSLMEKGIKLVSDGTDNHLMLVDLRNKGLTGKYVQNILDDVYITVNKNGIPFDTESPFITSGIRIGTPAVTARGMNEEDMKQIAEFINLAITDYENNKQIIRDKVSVLCGRYPLYR